MSKQLDVDMAGKVAIVTGATGGIGKEIARGLARMGATVILGARDAARGEAAQVEIAKDTGSKTVRVIPIDVANLASIRSFASLVGQGFGKVDVLVNNAGAWFTDKRASDDGVELTFATNVLGPHLLSKLLRDALAAAAPSRIVNVVSSFAGNFEADDLEFERRGFDGFKAYGASKQALRMLTWGLADRLAPARVTANAAAPGFVKTNFNQNAHGFMATMIGLSAKLFAVSAAEGADTPLWAAVAPELAAVTGKHFDARKEKDGKFREPGAIADLEARCEALLGRAARSRAA